MIVSDPVDRLSQALTTFTFMMVPLLVLIGITSRVFMRRLRGPGKVERALRDRLKGMKIVEQKQSPPREEGWLRH